MTHLELIYLSWTDKNSVVYNKNNTIGVPARKPFHINISKRKMIEIKLELSFPTA